MTRISFEYFPPRTAAQQATLDETHRQLKKLSPEYFSVTFGAGGSTQQFTEQTVLRINAEQGQQAAPHLSCIGSTRESICEILSGYQEAGISRLIALRGDRPSGMASAGELRYANELVELIRSETGDHFTINVACYPEYHPEAATAQHDLSHFKRKIDAGANEAITQYFFNADAYFRFVNDARDAGIDVAIVPGIMPITNYTQLARFSSICGAEIPRWLKLRLEGYGDDRSAISAFGVEFISELCQRLIEGGAPGLHFYTLNRADAASQICDNLSLRQL